MRRTAVLSAIIGTAAIAQAQSRADQVPPSRPDVHLPVVPAPSDEERDQPARAAANPEIVSPPPEPPSKLLLASKADDTLSRHLLVDASVSYTSAFGSLDSETSLSRLSAGYGLNLGVGYGVSRYVELQLEGSMSSFGSARGCPNCNGHSYALIGAARYHLVQGVRFDPWLRAGIGLSAFRLDDAISGHDYVGIQWLNAMLGGDWYIARNFGFGPMLAMTLTSYLDHPSRAHTSIAAQWLVGLNLTFDAAGK